MRSILVILAPALLAACAGPGGSTVSYGDEKNPNRVTAVSGLKSRDAANMANQAAYYHAKTTAPQRAIVSIKAHEGQQITLSGVKEFTVWAPSTEDDRLAAPTLAPTEFSENIRAAGAAARDVMSGATPIVGILEGAKTVRNGQDTALQAQQINAASNQAIAGQGIEAAGKVVIPPVYTVPMGSAHATPAAAP